MARIIIKGILDFLVLIVYRIKIIGKENIPKEGAALICPNHIHALDSVCIVVTAKRPIRGLAKESLYRFWILRFLSKTFGMYPVKKDVSSINTIKTAFNILKKGELLLIFPEGTRNGMAKGEKVKNGAVNIAIKSGVPIIPMGVQGKFKPFRKVKLNVGKPIYYDKNKIDVKNKEEIDKLTNELMQEIVRLRDEDNGKSNKRSR